MKKAFSLSEVLITLIIIGVISALTVPVILNTGNNSIEMLYKSSYNSFERVVTELINDVSIYPAGQLDNTFCTNFFARLNTIGAVDCTNASSFVHNPGVGDDEPNAVTSNGMRWYGMERTFGTDTCPDSAPGQCIQVRVDVNGLDGSNTTAAPHEQRDILDIWVFQTGKLTVPSGTQEEIYLTR